jgi:hypothetical protein
MSLGGYDFFLSNTLLFHCYSENRGTIFISEAPLFCPPLLLLSSFLGLGRCRCCAAAVYVEWAQPRSLMLAGTALSQQQQQQQTCHSTTTIIKKKKESEQVPSRFI